jgi:Peptidase family S41
MFSLLSMVLLSAAPDAGTATPVTNLVTLAKAWEAVRLFHPWLYERPIDWDRAWVEAAPKAEAAPTAEALHAVVDQMVGSLGDPVTSLHPKPTPVPLRDGPMFEVRGGVPVLFVGTKEFDRMYFDAALVARLTKALEGQRRVVVDLRGTSDTWVRLEALSGGGFGPSREARPPGYRGVVHHGYGAEGTSGGYVTGLEEFLQPSVPARPGPPRRYAFVIGPTDKLPALAQAMREVGEAVVVSVGAADDRALGLTTPLDLGIGMVLELRAGVLTSGRAFAPDFALPLARSAEAVDLALALVKAGPAKAAPQASGSVGTPHAIFDSAYADAPYPPRALRQLAGVRVWMVARRFWAYSHLAREDFDAVLARALPALGDAADSRAYAQALAELSTHLPDGHTRVSGPALQELLGPANAPVELRVVEGRFAVWRALPEAADAGVARGDVVLAVDGRPVAEREAFLGRYQTASHPEALRAKLCRRLLSGPPGSTAQVQLEQAGGAPVTVTLPRGDYPALLEEPPPPHYRVLEGNLGYVDLSHLLPEEVDPMFAALAGTRAIVFDDRGYPHGTGFTIGPRLNVKHPRGVARFQEPLVTLAWGEDADGARTFLQTLPPAQGALYTRPTVMLIDDQAISQSEHTGLIFEAYSGTTFVGSPTAGANGDVSFMPLPGGLRLSFTGHDVRHADGRQLQNIGLMPDVPVRPTLAGVRAGRDEVLEAAVRYLQTTLRPGP